MRNLMKSIFWIFCVGMREMGVSALRGVSVNYLTKPFLFIEKESDFLGLPYTLKMKQIRGIPHILVDFSQFLSNNRSATVQAIDL